MKIDRLPQLLCKTLKLTQSQEREADVHLSRKLMPKTARTTAGRSGPDHVFFFENHDIRNAAPPKLVRNDEANDAGTKDYDLSSALHLLDNSWKDNISP